MFKAHFSAYPLKTKLFLGRTVFPKNMSFYNEFKNIRIKLNISSHDIFLLRCVTVGEKFFFSVQVFRRQYWLIGQQEKAGHHLYSCISHLCIWDVYLLFLILAHIIERLLCNKQWRSRGRVTTHNWWWSYFLFCILEIRVRTGH